jgi:hypothetical protein
LYHFAAQIFSAFSFSPAAGSISVFYKNNKLPFKSIPVSAVLRTMLIERSFSFFNTINPGRLSTDF